MAKLRGKEIQALAKEIIRASPGGIRYSKLLERILSLHPETPNNTIQGAIWDRTHGNAWASASASAT